MELLRVNSVDTVDSDDSDVDVKFRKCTAWNEAVANILRFSGYRRDSSYKELKSIHTQADKTELKTGEAFIGSRDAFDRFKEFFGPMYTPSPPSDQHTLLVVTIPSYIEFKKWILQDSTPGNSFFFSDLCDSDSQMIIKAVVINGDKDSKRFITCLRTNSTDPRYRDVLHSSIRNRMNVFYLHRDIFEDMNAIFESQDRHVDALQAVIESQSKIFAGQDTFLATLRIMATSVEALKEHQIATQQGLDRILTIEKGESESNDTLHRFLEVYSEHQTQMQERIQEIGDCWHSIQDCWWKIEGDSRDMVLHTESFIGANKEMLRILNKGGVWSPGIDRVVRGHLGAFMSTVMANWDRILENYKVMDEHLVAIQEGLDRVLENRERLDKQRDRVAARTRACDPEATEEGDRVKN